jgi:hypothetical protein
MSLAAVGYNSDTILAMSYRRLTVVLLALLGPILLMWVSWLSSGGHLSDARLPVCSWWSLLRKRNAMNRGAEVPDGIEAPALRANNCFLREPRLRTAATMACRVKPLQCCFRFAGKPGAGGTAGECL